MPSSWIRSSASGDDAILLTRITSANRYVVHSNSFVRSFDATRTSRMSIVSGDANDVVRVGPGVPGVKLDGGNGQDLLIGGEGSDTIFGELGNDTVKGGAGADALSGNSGNDLVVGGAGNDKLYGHAGSDKLLGDGGNDRLFGGAGGDHIVGGAGTDSALIDPLDSYDYVENLID